MQYDAMLGKYLGKIRNQINKWDCNRTRLIAPSEEHTSYFSFVLHLATLCGPHSFSPKYSPKKSYKKMPKEEKYVLFHVQRGNFHTLDKILLWRWCGACDKYEVVQESWVFDAYFLPHFLISNIAKPGQELSQHSLVHLVGSNHSNNSKGNCRRCLFSWMT